MKLHTAKCGVCDWERTTHDKASLRFSTNYHLEEYPTHHVAEEYQVEEIDEEGLL